MQEINYNDLLKKAKSLLKHDRKTESEYIESQLKRKDFIQSYYSDVFNPMLTEIIRLTKLGHEIIVDKSYRRGQSQRIYYHLLPEQLVEAQDSFRKETQAQLDLEHQKRLDAIVTELAAEIEAEQQVQLAKEASAKSQAIKNAILQLLEQGA